MIRWLVLAVTAGLVCVGARGRAVVAARNPIDADHVRRHRGRLSHAAGGDNLPVHKPADELGGRQRCGPQSGTGEPDRGPPVPSVSL